MKQTRGIWLLERAAIVTCVSSVIALTVLDAWYAALFMLAVFFAVAFSERKLYRLALKAEYRNASEDFVDKAQKAGSRIGWECCWCGKVNRGIFGHCKFCGEFTARPRAIILPDDFSEEEESVVSDDVPTIFKDGE